MARNSISENLQKFFNETAQAKTDAKKGKDGVLTFITQDFYFVSIYAAFSD